ncbi:hypothetical protein L3X38_024967 [Prunus dulcis]|uniref:Retrotransposon gag domain-containing protein n=1 Tax=Prunus dulcis TaxID=3755 RepID=A0AAD4W2E6_PRUDU|nr:hypothetical protein L3X38_024967 [Prunus dulcis]
MGPKLGQEEVLVPAPVPEPVEQSVVGGSSRAAPAVPTMQGDPNFQQTLELLAHALARTGQPRDPSMGYADQAKRIGATDFDGDGTPAVAKEWIERIEQIMEVMAVPQNSRVTLATFFLIRNARHWWDSVKRRYRDPLTIKRRHSPGVGHAQGSTRIPKRNLDRVLSVQLLHGLEFFFCGAH